MIEEVEPGDLEAATAELRAVGAPYATARFPIAPAVMRWEAMQELWAACETLFDGLDALLSDVCGGDDRRLARLCRVPAHELPLLDRTPRHQSWAFVARPDIVLSGHRAVVVEANADSPAGLFAAHDVLLRAQESIPWTRARLRAAGARASQAMPALADALRGEMVDQEALVAIAYWKREESAAPMHWYLGCRTRELRRLGLEARLCAVEDLEITSGAVRSGGRRVGAVHRLFEAPEREAESENALLGRLLERVAAREVGLFTGYRGEIFASKICLALLSDAHHTASISTELRARLDRHIPWTRVVDDVRTEAAGERVDLFPWAISNRDLLVLKPVRGHSGYGLRIGRETAPREWEAALRRAVADGRSGSPAVLQALVQPDPEPFMATDGAGGVIRGHAPVNYAVFVVGRHPVGAVRRYGLGGTLNISSRFGLVPAPIWWTGAPTNWGVHNAGVTAARPESGARPA